MGEQNRDSEKQHALSLHVDRSTSDYYENLYSISTKNVADNMYSEAEYGNYKDLYNRVN